MSKINLLNFWIYQKFFFSNPYSLFILPGLQWLKSSQSVHSSMTLMDFINGFSNGLFQWILSICTFFHDFNELFQWTFQWTFTMDPLNLYILPWTFQWTFSVDFQMDFYNGSSQSVHSSMTSMNFFNRLFEWPFSMDFI